MQAALPGVAGVGANKMHEVKTRERLPNLRKSITHTAIFHTATGRIKFFVTVGLFDDGRPGELFITCDQTGSTLDGFSDCWAIAISLCLQNGVPLDTIVNKFSHHEFEPRGMTDNKKIPFAKSVPDYVVRWMATTFAKENTHEESPKQPL